MRVDDDLPGAAGHADEGRKATRIEARILGPLEVMVDGKPLPVRSRRQQVLLAVLLLNIGQVVATTELIDAVWGGHTPRTAFNQVAICMSSLRKLFAAAGAPTNTLQTRAPGYLLDAKSIDVDTHRVEQYSQLAHVLEEQGKLVNAAGLLGAAVGTWRGPVLSGLASDKLHGDAVLWEERKLSLTEQYVDLTLRAGGGGELPGYLAAQVSNYPLRERIRAQYMQVLCANGRQADALKTYREGRAILVREVGVEPGPELQQLHQEILHGQVGKGGDRPLPAAALTAAPAADSGRGRGRGTDPREPRVDDRHNLPLPQLLPADLADFVGRRQQVEELSVLLRRRPAAQHTAVPIGLVVGGGGVGKTTLAVHIAHLLAGDFPDGQLYINLHGMSSEPTDPVEALGRFLLKLGMDTHTLPEGLEQRAESYRNLIAGRRFLIVLDDAADNAQIGPLLPGTACCSVLVTSRRRLTDAAGARLIELPSFTTGEGRALLGRIAGQPRIDAEPGFADELLRLCEGLPLAVRITGARLGAKPHWTLEEMASRLAERRRLDELRLGTLQVRHSFSLSYDGLAPETQHAFRRLGVVEGANRSAWTAACLLECSIERAQEVMEQLVDAQLLTSDGRDALGLQRYRFHDLVAFYATEKCVEESHSTVQETASEYLARLLAVTRAAQTAYTKGDFVVLHSDLAPAEPSADIVAPACDRPLDWFDAERDAILAAIGQAARMGHDELCWDLAATCVPFFGTRCDYDGWRHSHEIALKAASHKGSDRGQAMILLGFGHLELTLQYYDRADYYLDLALVILSRLDEKHGLGLVLRQRAFIEYVHGQIRDALRTCEKARVCLELVGDLPGCAQVAYLLCLVHLELGDAKAARHEANQARAISGKLGERGQPYAQVLYSLAQVAMFSGDCEVAQGLLREAMQIVVRIRDRRGEAYVLWDMGRAEVCFGNFAAALVLLTESLTISRQIGEQFVEAHCLHELAALHDRMGANDEARLFSEQAAAKFAQIGTLPLKGRSVRL